MRSVTYTVVIATDDKGKQLMRTFIIAAGQHSQDQVDTDTKLVLDTLSDQLRNDGKLQPFTSFDKTKQS